MSYPASSSNSTQESATQVLQAGQIIAHYSDVLRVGHLLVGTSVATWETDCSMQNALSSFTSAFNEQWHNELAKADPQYAGFGTRQMPDIVYWVCKATSVNYCLAEVMSFLQRALRITSPLSVETYDSEESRPLLEYVVYPRPEHREIAVELKWRRAGQITCLDMESGERSVWGSLTSVRMAFPVPPGPTFLPQFEVKFERNSSWRRVPSFVRNRSWSLGSREEVGHCSNPTGIGDTSSFATTSPSTFDPDASGGTPVRTNPDMNAASASSPDDAEVPFPRERYSTFTSRRPLIGHSYGLMNDRANAWLPSCCCCRRRRVWGRPDCAVLTIIAVAVVAILVLIATGFASQPRPSSIRASVAEVTSLLDIEHIL